MATMNISLPDPMKDWVETRAAAGRYGNAGDYIRDLIRRDQERVNPIADIQRPITEGLDSGVSDRSMKDTLETARLQVRTAPE